MVRRIFAACACFTVCSALAWSAACSAIAIAEEPLRISGRTMGSYYAITIDEPGGADVALLQRDIEQLLAELNRQMSTWDDASQVSQFNQSRDTDWYPVGKEFAEVAAEALRLHQLTGGALDITLAPLIEAWGFGRSRRPRVPSEAEISAALSEMGPQHLEVRRSASHPQTPSGAADQRERSGPGLRR